MEDRKADADTHLADARSQNTENGISGELQKIKTVAEAAVFLCLTLEILSVTYYNLCIKLINKHLKIFGEICYYLVENKIYEIRQDAL